MMHHVCRLADERGLTFQFHTGIQAGNGNYIRNADPTLLANLFMEYPNIKFDLFHIGYPFQHVLSALAKNFPNVFIDMCWAHIVSPEASVRALEEWLDAVPYNKISAFGGDYAVVDAVYGHQVLARRNVSRALGRKIIEGCFDVETARVIARRLLYDNPMEIFRLQEKGIAEDAEK
jgi:predicted TIM-barrel fold metal-dependent hydrolase